MKYADELRRIADIIKDVLLDEDRSVTVVLSASLEPEVRVSLGTLERLAVGKKCRHEHVHGDQYWVSNHIRGLKFAAIKYVNPVAPPTVYEDFV